MSHNVLLDVIAAMLAGRLRLTSAVAAGALLLLYPIPGLGQMHMTGFSYGFTTKGASLQQRLRQSSGSSADVVINSQYLVPAGQILIQPPGPIPLEAENHIQQTISNSRTESQTSSLTLLTNFNYSVFRNNQLPSLN